MDGSTLVNFAGILAVSVIASLAVLWIAGTFSKPKRLEPHNLPEPHTNSNTFLFRNGLLIDHDCNLPNVKSGIDDWSDLRNWLGRRFSDLPEFLPDDASSTNTFSAVNEEDTASVTIATQEGVARIILEDPVESQPAARHQAIALQIASSECNSALHSAPCAIWKIDRKGSIIWKNDACEKMLGDEIDRVMNHIDTPKEPDQSKNSRVAIPRSDKLTQTWLDVHVRTAENSDVFYAIDITNAVNAEAAQREFVQTLTKTFANLTTGLAIFDRNQQLALFNPALVDLTVLPAEFLSGRPTLMSFFDNLRDRQVMPEPKNYADWRAQINEMIQTASDGLYQETWALPSGVTYRVTGRPHPDGAVAFLFEDITAEISLTRRFRAQNDLRQAVMDKLDHAVAVIASNNVVIFCNAAWTELFGVDPDTSFAELGIRDLVAICRQKYPHPDFWQTVESQTTCKTLSHPIEETIETDAHGPLHCRLVPVSGGATLICQQLEHSVSRPGQKASSNPEPIAS